MIKKLDLTLAAINGGQETAILTAKADFFPYANGKKSSETPIGVKFTVALQGNKFTSLDVKIKGVDPLPNVTDEQLTVACATMKYPIVKFTDCKVTLYPTGGIMTAEASGIELVNGGK
ncbi:MAG: hypothetical protein FWG44_00210 [Oscillospiraceae bacterium]|nr:hypothetical protein [Oscillospiraceae bacterium]